MNYPESEVPRPNSLEDSSSALFILDATSEYDEVVESFSDSEDSSSECDFEQSEGENDSNSNYLDEPPRALS